MRSNLQNLIEKALEESAVTQINLSSKAAREVLAKRISEVIQGKFYVTPYFSQESFE
jgi:hypothetical protein